MKSLLIGNDKTKAAWLKWGAIALFLTWLFYSLSAYYVVQKPFSMPLIAALLQQTDVWWRLAFSATALARTLLDLSTAVWLALVALGVGLYCLNALALSLESPLETTLYALGLGFGALGLGTLGLGLAGLLQPAVFYAILFILTLLTARPTLTLLRQWRPQRPPRLLGTYLIIAVGLALALALLPPTSWDGLFYHLTGPKLYLEAGRIYPGVDIPHLNFPSLFEMLFLVAMAVRSDVAAVLLHFIFHLMLAGLVYVMARDQLRVENGWTAILFLYAMPMVLALASWAYNDLALAFYQVAALNAVLQWRRRQQRQWLVLAGALGGLAMGLKYTSFVAPLVLAGVIVWHDRAKPREAIRLLLFFAFTAALVAAPWYLKNWFFTGNPTYPFVFGGRFWNEFRAAAYAGSGTGLGFDPIAWLRLPHDLTLALQDASQDGPTGPFFLIFLPWLLVYGLSRLGRSAPPAFRLLLLFALAQYVFWMVGVIFSSGLWQSRLLLPAFVALCPALAWMLQDLKRLDHPQFSLRRFLAMVIGFALALNLMGQLLTWLPSAPLAYVLGTDTRDEVLLRHLGVYYKAMMDMNQQLPPDAIVVFLWEPRSYYCDRDCRPDSILDTFGHLEYRYGTAGNIAAFWRKAGVTHVLLHQAGLDFVVAAGYERIAPNDMNVLTQLRAQYLDVVAGWDGAYTLYELKP